MSKLNVTSLEGLENLILDSSNNGILHDGSTMVIRTGGSNTLVSNSSTLVVGSSNSIIANSTHVILNGIISSNGNLIPSPASQASGDILYRGATEWERLTKGTAKQVLAMNSGASAPEWVSSASDSEFRNNTTDKLLDTDGVWNAATSVTLTDAATIAVDMATFLNATVTLEGNRTLGQPTNTKVGQSGVIRIIQDATGSRTLAYHADWKFAGGSDPTASTAPNSVDLLYYYVVAANFIHASLNKAIS